MSSEADPPVENSAPRSPTDVAAAAVAHPSSERDWTPWLDGRPRRLKRGRDYTGDPKALIRRARAAAEALGRVAVESRDSQGKYEYVWIQFVHGEVEPGLPCPVCTGTVLEKVQKFFLRCANCGAVLTTPAEREVTPGSFAVQAREIEEEVANSGPPEPEPEPEQLRTGTLAEILEIRVLGAGSARIESAPAAEPITIETVVRTHRPGLRARAVCGLLASPSAKAGRIRVLTSMMDSARSVPETGVHVFRARLPANLLSHYTYTVSVALQLENPLDGTREDVVDREGASFSIDLDVPEDRPAPGIIHPAISWSVDLGEA